MPRQDEGAAMRAALMVVEQYEYEANGQIKDRGYHAQRLRLSGMQWDDIAKELNYPTAQAAYRASNIYLSQAAVLVDQERKVEALELSLARCERLIQGYWKPALAGDLDSANYVLKVMAEEHKLLKLYEEQGGTQVHKYVVVTASRDMYLEDLKQIAGDAEQLAINGKTDPKGT